MRSCACGCGQATSLIRKTSARQGHVRGEYHRFVRGHNNWQNLDARFESKVVKGDGCWDWQGTVLKNGYGAIVVTSADGKRSTYAHRLSYERSVGTIPPGMYVCHHCDNRRCVRPDHLFLGTHLDNMADMRAKGRQSRQGPPSGVDAYQTKVTPEISRQIQLLFASGRWSKAELARRFEVSHRTIRAVLDGTHYTRRAA